MKEQLNRFEMQSWRCWTIILYCNEGWVPDHGGCLRLLHETNGKTDVPPKAGRAVLFNSLKQHEVLQTALRDRWALTMWVWREDSDQAKFTIS